MLSEKQSPGREERGGGEEQSPERRGEEVENSLLRGEERGGGEGRGDSLLFFKEMLGLPD